MSPLTATGRAVAKIGVALRWTGRTGNRSEKRIVKSLLDLIEEQKNRKIYPNDKFQIEDGYKSFSQVPIWIRHSLGR